MAPTNPRQSDKQAKEQSRKAPALADYTSMTQAAYELFLTTSLSKREDPSQLPKAIKIRGWGVAGEGTVHKMKRSIQLKFYDSRPMT